MTSMRHLPKPFALILLLMMVAAPAWGQSTFESQRVQYGGFAGPEVKFSSMNGESVLLLGGRAGWMINLDTGHTFILGIGAYGVMNDIVAEGVTVNEEPVHLGLDYGGADFAYMNRTLHPVLLSVQLFIGAGAIDYREETARAALGGNTGDGFFIVEPGVSVTLHVLRMVRLNGGVSYRFLNGVSHPGATGANLNGVSGVVSLQLGRF